MINSINQAVIFAGGLGERLKPFTLTNPKPMFPINGKPFIEYLIVQIKNFGIKDIIILLGYLPDKIQDYLGNGEKYGVSIRYVITEVECDTQFRLKAASKFLQENFLMMYCDNICPINFGRLCENYYKHGALIEITAYENSDNYTKNNLKIEAVKSVVENEDIVGANACGARNILNNNSAGKVIVYDKKRTTEGLLGVDIGYAIVSKKVLNYMSDANENFEAVVYPKLVSDGKLFATITKHRYYSIGSYERIKLTEKFLSDQKYIFLDRDGTLNLRPKKAEYICKPSDFIWLDGAKEAIKKLNDAGYFIIMISNQAGIARGAMSIDDFNAVQEKIKQDLNEIGAHIDAVYFCPHGWDDNCECRKPKPGMLFKAQKDFSINLTNCIMIGDDERDIETAANADMKGILVNDNYKLIDAVNDLLLTNKGTG